MDREPSEEDDFDLGEYLRSNEEAAAAEEEELRRAGPPPDEDWERKDEDPDRDHDWLDTPGG